MAETSPTLPPLEHEPQLRGAASPDSPAEAAARDGVEPARANWEWAVTALGLLMILAGVALAGFPFLLDFTSGAAAANTIVCGGVAIFLGVLRVAGVRHPLVGYAAMLVGAWLFASSFFVGELAREAWTERFYGAGVFLLGTLGLTRLTPDPAHGAASSDLR
ncbi:MAG TPA: hypothetical protein VFY99_05015 [Solirubrobacterales bacterium]